MNNIQYIVYGNGRGDGRSSSRRRSSRSRSSSNYTIMTLPVYTMIMLFMSIMIMMNNIMMIHAIAFVESSCSMKTTFLSDHSNTVSTEDVYQMEQSISNYFTNVLIIHNDDGTTDDISNQNQNNNMILQQMVQHIDPIQFRIEIADSIMIDNLVTIVGTVSLLYETKTKRLHQYNNTTSNKYFSLASTLTQAVVVVEPKNYDIPFTFTTDSTSITFQFTSIDDDENNTTLNGGTNNNNIPAAAVHVLSIHDDTNYTSTEIGLIVVTVFLSCVLLIVSSVLLYITGGWNVCCTKITNCLFEEIDDDNDNDDNHPQSKNRQYHVQSQKTFPIQQSHDEQDQRNNILEHEDMDDHDDKHSHHMDVESTITSVPPSTASGILGVSRNHNVPVNHHMMMDTPTSKNLNDDDSNSMMYGDGSMTPTTIHQDIDPLGITSMRKLQQSTSGSSSKRIMNHTTTTSNHFFTGMMMRMPHITRSATKQK